ncbi:MAG TPA: hypothetical protein VHB99_14675 [Pirellulales bacterium]|nr:hypothetical protein [Pirellulales bacterium]
MSAALSLARRSARQVARPFKAILKTCLRYLIRRLSTRFAADILPLEELADRVAEIAARQDRQEGFHWDHSALAKRLATIEDHLERLLQQTAAPEEAAGALPVIRFAPEEPAPTTPLVHERQYRWDRAG